MGGSARARALHHMSGPPPLLCVRTRILPCVCSADFSLLVTASSDGTAKVWNFATAQVIRTLR